MDEGAKYYQLPLWHEYLAAKTRWEHAHAEYVADPQSRSRAKSRETLMETRAVVDDLLAQLRKRPEHLELFGW